MTFAPVSVPVMFLWIPERVGRVKPTQEEFIPNIVLRSLKRAMISHQDARTSIRRRWLQMHVAIDETYAQGPDQFAMVALAATDDEWIDFADNWYDVLGRQGLEYLHCKNHLTGSRFDLAFISKLSLLIKKHVQGASIIGVDKGAYEDIAKRHKKRVNYREFVFTNVFEKVMIDMTASGIAQNISFICDDSEQDAQAQYRVWSNMRRKSAAVKLATPSISFADDIAVAPLQAADLIAWLYNQEISRDRPWSGDSPFRDAWPLDEKRQPNVSIEVWKKDDLERHEDAIFASRVFVLGQRYGQ